MVVRNTGTYHMLTRPDPPLFLGVDASLTGRRWVGPSPEVSRKAEALAQTGLPGIVASVLASRGIGAEGVADYLAPTLRALLPDPRALMDMETAAARLIAALDGKQRIAIFADYDVDGGASAALLIDWLAAFGRTATLYVPDRIDEGYGPNPPAMARLAAEHDLILCVDCGTLSHDAIAAAAGADVVIVDHHLGGETLPDALAVVNPNRQDETGDLAHLCAAAVVFLLLVEANRQLRPRGTALPDLLQMLDLVALATVADVAPLTGVNRAFVRQGLKVMARRGRAGLSALADVARLTTAPAAYHLGYVLGPRINAGGRVGLADMGARCLACGCPDEARSLAERLDGFNDDRREIETAVRDAALEQALGRQTAALSWAADDGWHPGVVGIVAARLKEATNRPSVVIGFDGDIGKGSARSVPGVDLGHAIQRLAAEGLLIKGGGHKMAAGLTVARDKLAPAMARLDELMARAGAGTGGPRDLRLDGVLMPSAATADLTRAIDSAGPYGQAAPAPRIAFPSVRIRHAKTVGSGHLKLTIGDPQSGRIDAIAFGAMDGDLGPALLAHGGAPFHLAGKLDLNHWQGRETVQLRLDDAAPA